MESGKWKVEVFLHEWIKSVFKYFFVPIVWKVVTSFIVYIHLFT